MKLMVKTLQGSQFAVEVADDIGVKDLKGVIAETQGDDAFSPDRQKLIHAGKILADDKARAARERSARERERERESERARESENVPLPLSLSFLPSSRRTSTTLVHKLRARSCARSCARIAGWRLARTTLISL